MKRVLLLDTAFAALPIYNYLSSLNCELWVMGNRCNDALAIHAGDKWIQQDYSNVAAVKHCIDTLKIDYVVPGCTDMSIETCLRLGVNRCAFDDIGTYNKLGNKNEFRRICSELDLPSPNVHRLEDFPITGKFICKPVDAFSGRGVNVVNGSALSEITQAYEMAVGESPSAEAIIEEYIDGQLYSFSAFIEKQTVIDYFVVKEGSSVNPYAVDTSYVDDSVDNEIISLLKINVEKIGRYFKLKDGLVHVQFIVSQKKPYFVEITRRCPGDLYSYLVESSTGYAYAAKYASYFVSEEQKSEIKYTKYILRHTIASKNSKAFLDFRFVVPVQVHSYFPLLLLGNRIDSNQKTRVGILFCEENSGPNLEKGYQSFLAREVYNLNGLHHKENGNESN